MIFNVLFLNFDFSDIKSNQEIIGSQIAQVLSVESIAWKAALFYTAKGLDQYLTNPSNRFELIIYNNERLYPGFDRILNEKRDEGIHIGDYSPDFLRDRELFGALVESCYLGESSFLNEEVRTEFPFNVRDELVYTPIESAA